VVSAGLRDCGIAGASTGSQFLGGRGVCGAGVCLAATRERLPEVVARLGGDGYETLADFPGWEPMFGYRVLQKRPMGLRKRPSDSDGHPAGITAAGDWEDGVARAAQ
jgi:hypothetical protein